MSGRLKASLCLPQGTLKSTTGVCLVVFFPSIHTSDQGIELIVIEQSPPPESSDGAADRRATGASSVPVSPPPLSSTGASRGRLRFGVVGPEAIAPPPEGPVPGPVDGPLGGFVAAPAGLLAGGVCVAPAPPGGAWFTSCSLPPPLGGALPIAT